MTATQTAETHDTATIPSYAVGQDLVILHGETALVSSKSHPGQWREVDAVNMLCSCPAFVGIPGKFEGRGVCRHVAAVKEAMEMDRAASEPIDERPICPLCRIRRCAVIANKLMKSCSRCSNPLHREIQREEQMARDLGLPDREWEKEHGISRNN